VIGVAGGFGMFQAHRPRVDAVVDYKRGDLGQQLCQHTPDRADVFFDNSVATSHQG